MKETTKRPSIQKWTNKLVETGIDGGETNLLRLERTEEVTEGGQGSGGRTRGCERSGKFTRRPEHEHVKVRPEAFRRLSSTWNTPVFA